jgi:precorrin-2 dehydrogenase
VSAFLYPLFLNLRGRLCIVVGGTEVAETKIRELLDTAARVRVISPTVTPQIAGLADAGKVEWQARRYQSGDVAGAFLAIAASDLETNSRVFEEAEAHQIFCNAVDDIEHCNCYASAVVRRGPLQIAISTAGNSPALAQRLRRELEQTFGAEYAAWVTYLGQLRSDLIHQDGSIGTDQRRSILHEQASASSYQKFRTSLAADDRQTSGADPAASAKST